jgi:hypothetical protein
MWMTHIDEQLDMNNGKRKRMKGNSVRDNFVGFRLSKSQLDCIDELANRYAEREGSPNPNRSAIIAKLIKAAMESDGKVIGL